MNWIKNILLTHTNLPSKVFNYLSYCRQQEDFKDYTRRYTIDQNVRFGSYPILYGEGLLIIDGGTHIGVGATILAHKDRMVHIGSNCDISHYLAIYTANRSPADREVIETGDVIIGDNVWIGHTVYINQGVTIGEGAVIGAHSVVIDDILPHCVAVGVPAKVVKVLEGGQGK